MYRKNVAGQNLPFVLINASNGAALTGATVTARRTIDGGAQAAATGTVSELANGEYNLALSQADTNGNDIGILLTATNAVPVHFTLVTTAADPTNAATFGITDIDAAISSRLASASITLSAGAVTVGTNNDKTGYGLTPAESWILDQGTAQAGTSGGITLRASAPSVNLVNCLIKLISGTGAGQARIISFYNTSTKVVNLYQTWYVTPDNTTGYVVLYQNQAQVDIDGGVILGTTETQAISASSFASNALGAVWDELTANHVIAGSFGQLFQSARFGTAQGGTGQSITLDAGASATTNFYVGDFVQITGGTGAGQGGFISAYNGSTKVASVLKTWITTPDNTSQFVVIPWDSVAPFVMSFLTTQCTAPGSVGLLLASDVPNLDAAVSSRLAAAAYTTPPTVGQIDTQLSGTHGAGLWGGAAGSGANTVTLTIQTNLSVPIANVPVSVKNTAETAIVAMGVTDVNGNVVVNLNNGTYHVIILSSPFYAALPAQVLTVSGTTAATYQLTPFVPPPPGNPSLCAVFGNLKNLDGSAAANQTVLFTLLSANAYQANDNAIVVTGITVITDANGHFQANLTQGSQFTGIGTTSTATYLVSCPAARLNHSFVVPTATSADLLSLTLTPLV